MPWVSSGTWTRGVRGWVLWRSAHRCLVGSVLRATPGKGRGSKGVVQSWSEMAARSLILLLPPVPDQSLDAGSPEVNDGWRAKAACRQPSRPRTPSPSLKGDLDTLCRPHIDLPPSSHMPLPLHLLSPLGEYTWLSPQIITPSMPFSQETL